MISSCDVISAILSNSGHFDNEINVGQLKELASSTRTVRPLFDEYVINGKRIYLAGEGRLVNLACAEGHPSAVMSTSFCGQALAVEYCVKNKGKLPIEVITLPEEIDTMIAQLQIDLDGGEPPVVGMVSAVHVDRVIPRRNDRVLLARHADPVGGRPIRVEHVDHHIVAGRPEREPLVLAVADAELRERAPCL